MLNELMYKKTKNGWMCYDRNGNNATGITKDHARAQYNLYYNVINNQEYISNTIDFKKYNKEL